MIRVNKPAEAPKVLNTKGQEDTKEKCQAYAANSTAYHNGELSFQFKSNIYNHSSVKPILKAAQHNKCCFCEKEQIDEPGAIEHYRPKGGYQKQKGGKLYKPGYYWLAYAWSNLYFVCSTCNTNKGNYFPLAHEAKRATNHTQSTNQEEPFIIDPGGNIDPRAHIYFSKELPKSDTFLGKTTIRACKLNRESLNEMRRKLISDIELRLKIVFTPEGRPHAEVQQCKAWLKAAMKPEAPFSAMAIDFIKPFIKV